VSEDKKLSETLSIQCVMIQKVAFNALVVY
jgi:hypothetical protein